MERWKGRVALVTGASVGIGAAVARALVQQGMRVVGCARSVDKIEVGIFNLILLNDLLNGGEGGKGSPATSCVKSNNKLAPWRSRLASVSFTTSAKSFSRKRNMGTEM